MRKISIVLAACLLIIAGCSAPALYGAQLTVYAASSLSNVMWKITDPFMGDDAWPWRGLVVSTGSSTALRVQIEQGAPADVFLSADSDNPQALKDAGLIDGELVTFATSQLTIIVPEDNPARITSPADLARPGVAIIAAGEEVPISRYVDQLLSNLSGLPGYPADLAASYLANVVSREDNVGAVASKIALGEGDAAIVYDNIPLVGPGEVAIPSAANVTTRYVAVVPASSQNRQAAHEFVAWLLSRDGQIALQGFGPPR